MADALTTLPTWPSETAKSATSPPPGRGRSYRLAYTYLQGHLSKGPLPAKDVEAAMERMHVPRRTYFRVRKLLGVASVREGGIGAAGRWWLSLGDS